MLGVTCVGVTRVRVTCVGVTRVGVTCVGVTCVGVGCVVLQYLAILGGRQQVVLPLGDVLLEVV